MVKLLDVWQTATGRGSPANGAASPAALLTDADLDWEDGDFDPDAPDLPEFVRDHLKEKQYEKQTAAGFEQKQHQTAQAARESEATERDRRMREWLASEQYRRAYQALCDDISDAKAAAREAYGRALTKEQATREALEEARRHALVLAGNLVYFTRDGKHLYGEDGREIMEADSVAEARRQQAQQPEATTYEDYRAKRQSTLEAIRNAERLRTAIGRLDDLDDRIKRGNLSPEELAQAQKEKQDVIDSLPREARERYERLHAARENSDQGPANRAVDPAFAAAPNLATHFQRAGTAAATQTEPVQPVPNSQPGRAPAYRAPEF
jgi:hypothetical protein